MNSSCRASRVVVCTTVYCLFGRCARSCTEAQRVNAALVLTSTGPSLDGTKKKTKHSLLCWLHACCERGACTRHFNCPFVRFSRALSIFPKCARAQPGTRKHLSHQQNCALSHCCFAATKQELIFREHDL